MNNQQKAAALWLSVAMGAVAAVKEMEPAKSARWNRLDGAEDKIGRCVDLYRVEHFSTADMDNACALLDLINEKVKELYP